MSNIAAVKDVVQLDPAHCSWGPVFVIVTEVKKTCILGYFLVPEERDTPPGCAYVWVNHEHYVRIGRAEWIVAPANVAPPAEPEPPTEISKNLVPHMSHVQWTRLELLLLDPGVVIESAWLQSAAGVRRDSARAVMAALQQAGVVNVSFNVFHCAEHPVERVSSMSRLTSPWVCPDCEETEDIGDDPDNFRGIHLELHMVLTKPVVFV